MYSKSTKSQPQKKNIFLGKTKGVITLVVRFSWFFCSWTKNLMIHKFLVFTLLTLAFIIFNTEPKYVKQIL